MLCKSSSVKDFAMWNNERSTLMSCLNPCRITSIFGPNNNLPASCSCWLQSSRSPMYRFWDLMWSSNSTEVQSSSFSLSFIILLSALWSFVSCTHSCFEQSTWSKETVRRIQCCPGSSGAFVCFDWSLFCTLVRLSSSDSSLGHPSTTWTFIRTKTLWKSGSLAISKWTKLSVQSGCGLFHISSSLSLGQTMLKDQFELHTNKNLLLENQSKGIVLWCGPEQNYQKHKSECRCILARAFFLL